MNRFLSCAAVCLVIATRGLTDPAWGNKAGAPSLDQVTDQAMNGLDAKKVKELEAEADRLIEAGKYAEASTIAEQILAWREANLGPGHIDTAASCDSLAFLYAKQGLYGKAETLYKQAIAIRSKALGPEHPETAQSLHGLAFLYADQQLYAKAESLHTQALTINQKVLGQEDLAISISLNNLGMLYEDQGLFTNAEQLYERALVIRENALGLDHPDNARLISNLARIYLNQGFYDKAEPLYQRALAIHKKNLGSEHINTATSLNDLAYTYYARGLYAKAEPLYQKALAINEKTLGPEHLNTATSLNNLAALNNRKGFYAKAESLYVQALAIFQKALGPEHPDIAYVHNNLAMVYRSQGLYAKAEALYQVALEIREKALGPEHPLTASTLNNLGALYYFKGHYAKAQSLYKRGLSIREKVLGPDHPETAQSLNNLATLYLILGLYSKAEPLYHRSLEINQKAFGSENPLTTGAISNLALLYFNQGLYARSEPLYQRAFAINEKLLGPEHPDTVNSLNKLATSYETLGLYSKAESIRRRGLTAEFNLIQREAAYMPVSERQSFLQNLGDSSEFAFSSAQRGSAGANLALFSRLNRQGLLQEIEQRQAQLASLPGRQEVLADQIRAVTNQLASMTISLEQRQQLRSRKEELEKQLYRILPQLKPRVVEVQQVADALPAGSALIEFQRYRPFDGTKTRTQRAGEARYLALVLKANDAITPIDLGLAKPIDALIQSALEASEQKQADALKLWAQVGRMVLHPLSAATRGVNTLFISPDGELNRVPFAALPAPDSSQFLSEALQLRLLTTGRELLDLQNTPSVNSSQALVVANPAFDRTPVFIQSPRLAISSQRRSGDLGSRRWAPLPGTATEGIAIAQLTGSRLLTGEQATAAEIQQQQQAPRLLHLATHAYFQPDLPEAERKEDQPLRSKALGPTALGGENPLLRSGIVLAGANQPDANPADDGYLTALEVAGLNWKGTELVVISACESGKGDIQAGEGVYGLKRSIAVAGARSSLLSLWKVDDQATAAFMESFYNKLMAGMGKADALAATQQQFRQSTNATWSHPYVWAAFQLSGDWGMVSW